MKNMITKTVMAASVVAVMGTSSAFAKDTMTPEAFVQAPSFSTEEMMSHMSADSNGGIFGGVKAILSPVKNYILNTAYETTSCVITVNGIRFR